MTVSLSVPAGSMEIGGRRHTPTSYRQRDTVVQGADAVIHSGHEPLE
jgi:hypothetical protein